MDRINGLNQIIEVLRKQYKQTERKTGVSTRDNKSSVDSARPKSGAQQDIKVLENKLIERIKSVKPYEGDPRKQATYIFIESVLTWEFGEHLLNDPEFHDLVLNIKESIESIDKLNTRFSQLFQEMADK